MYAKDRLLRDREREVSGTGDMAGVNGWTKSQPFERESGLDGDL